MFLENLVNAFDVGIDRTRIGLAQYSGDPRVEWHLNAFTTKDGVLDAVKNLPYKGGNTLTGLALTFILENSFKAESGSRSDVPKIGILITDGKSQDDVVDPSESLRRNGVELFAIGVKNADEEELRAIASEPDVSHVYNVADFNIMASIVEGLTQTVCHRVEEQDKDIKLNEPEREEPEIGEPRNLLTSEVTARSFRVSWTHAPGNVEKYRVVYHPSQGGGQPQEVVVSGGENSVLLQFLSSMTEYQLAVFAVYPDSASAGLRGNETTLALPAVGGLQLYDVTHSSMRAGWEPVEGGTGFMVLYAPLTEDRTAEEREVRVSEDVTELELQALLPDTEYAVTVYAMHGEETSDPNTSQETTLPLRPPRNLKFSDITHNSAHISWAPAYGKVKGYRIMYVKTDGLLTEEVDVGPAISSYVLSELSSLMEYSVAIFSLYDEGQSEALTDGFTTRPLSSPGNLRVSEEGFDRLRLTWVPPLSTPMGYRIIYQPTSVPGVAMATAVGEDVDTVLLVHLLPGTEYTVTVIASYRSGQSEPLTGTASTLFLGVSNLKTYQVRPTSLCVQWQPLPQDVLYRVAIESPLNGQRQEVRDGGGASRHCFYELTPNSQYQISVYASKQETEGPAVSTKEMTLPAPTQAVTQPPTTVPLPTIPPAKEVCKAAKADLVFLVDGSWSIGDDNFQKIIHFLYSTMGALDLIGPDGTQVAIAQFSDNARTEFQLSSYGNKETLLEAVQRISYKGGNTKTGGAVKHVKESVFTPEGGARRGVPRILVVLTDGRSQDDVNMVSKEMQEDGFIIFAIGFADADYGELVNMASQPSDRHVFFVDDLDAVRKIEEQLITFICEAATATCPSVLMSGNTIAGFRMMERFGLVEKEYASVPGVSLEPGSFNSFPSYRLHRHALLSQPTRYLHPEGLPSDFTITMMLRLLSETPQEPFALWEILNKEEEPLVGLILDISGKTLTFFNHDFNGDIQRVTFDGPDILKIFHGSFHKLHVTVSRTSARVVLDCKVLGEKALRGAGNITVDGVEVLGRLVRSQGRRDNSAPFQLQMFDIICSSSWASRDKCCELPGLRVEADCPSVPHACSCSQDSKGPPGPTGPRGGPGIRGARGNQGEPGGPGPQGAGGERGSSGPQGPLGPQGPSGLSMQGPTGSPGERGERGETGLPGPQGVPGGAGSPGRDGPPGPRGVPGKDGPQGQQGTSGPMGSPGGPGAMGPSGAAGSIGEPGVPGRGGFKGEKGERGDLQSQAAVQSIARQVCEQLIQSHLSRYNSVLNQIPSQPVAVRTVTGPPGEPGRRGAAGPQGEQGPSGRPGFPGASGLNGRPGERGLAGEKGERGSQGVGTQGPRGPPGPPGLPGEGRTGSQGPPGRPGNQGTPGRAGTPGSTGPAGAPGYCDQNACMGYNVGVQALPITGYQPYQPAGPYDSNPLGEEEEEEEEEQQEEPYGYRGYPPQYFPQPPHYPPSDPYSRQGYPAHPGTSQSQDTELRLPGIRRRHSRDVIGQENGDVIVVNEVMGRTA
ncbi:collagen alpha-1(XIV) chain [Aplochiton taeniatus]